MAGHTPGPWRVDSTKALGAYGVWTENADPRNPGHDGAGYQVQICSMNPADRDTPIRKEERNANARLIAAAPDMLAELKKLEWSANGHDFLKLCPSCGGMLRGQREYGSHYPPGHSPKCTLAAAIARAEGKDDERG